MHRLFASLFTSDVGYRYRMRCSCCCCCRCCCSCWCCCGLVGRAYVACRTGAALYIDVRVFDLRMCTFACVCLSCLVPPQLLSYAVSTYMDLVATTSRGAGGKTHLVLWTYEKAVRVLACNWKEAKSISPHTHSAHTTARCLLRGRVHWRTDRAVPHS